MLLDINLRLGPRLVLDRARGGRRLAELRGNDEPFANADEVVRRRSAYFVVDLLSACAEVPINFSQSNLYDHWKLDQMWRRYGILFRIGSNGAGRRVDDWREKP
ncbi:hypothetical protein ACFX2A_025048 [Malus domestica]